MLEMREMIANTGAATDNDITDDATGAGRGMRRQAAQRTERRISRGGDYKRNLVSLSDRRVDHRPVFLAVSG